MAPEETSTISRSPPLRIFASTSTSASTRSASRPPAAVVSDEEPTLTTILRAALTACLAPATLRSVPSHTRDSRPAIYAKGTAARAPVQSPDRRDVTVCSRVAYGKKVALVAYRNQSAGKHNLNVVSPTEPRRAHRILLRSGKSPFDVFTVEEALHQD